MDRLGNNVVFAYKWRKSMEKTAEKTIGNNQLLTSEMGWELLRRAQQVVDKEETLAKCYRVPVGTVRVQRSELGNVRFAGLLTCKSAWSCPICSIRRARKRSFAVQEMANRIVNSSVMITYTVQHNPIDKLEWLMHLLYESLRSARSGSNMAKHRKHSLGYVRATEVMYGRAGWHPHIHELNWLNRYSSEEDLIETVVSQYKNALRKSGKNVNQYTVTAEKWDGKTDYITKDVDVSEITSGHLKSGQGSITPFEMLNISEKHHKMEHLFREFHYATKRRKKLIVSRSLQSIYKEATEFVNQEVENTAWTDVSIIPHDEWYRILAEGSRWNVLMTYKRD